MKKRWTCAAIALCFVVVFSALPCAALTGVYTGGGSADLDVQQGQTVYDRIAPGRYEEAYQGDAAIVSMDVRDDGALLIAFSKAAVNFYDPNGNYLYSYRFSYRGDYAAFFHEDLLILALFEEGVMLALHEDGSYAGARALVEDRIETRFSDYGARFGSVYLAAEAADRVLQYHNPGFFGLLRGEHTTVRLTILLSEAGSDGSGGEARTVLLYDDGGDILLHYTLATGAIILSVIGFAVVAVIVIHYVRERRYRASLRAEIQQRADSQVQSLESDEP